MTTLTFKKTAFVLSVPIKVKLGRNNVQETKFSSFARPTVEANLKLARSSAMSFLRTNKDVEDSFEYSDALIGLWRATESWTAELAAQSQCTWTTYAIRCMRNAILGGYRKRKIKYHEELVDFNELQFVDPRSGSVVSELFEEADDDTFNNRRAKSILREYYLDKKTLKEIANDYGISSPAVHQLIKRAKVLLRSKFGLVF
jgi:RNA polymerase sigma factor (sigma-70 family)